jgi:hypothetical protein
MTKSSLISIAVIAFVFLLVHGPILYFRFQGLCEKVAKATGRVDEFNDVKRDDGGLNQFENEMFWKLMGGTAGANVGASLQQEAAQLRRQFFCSFGIVIILSILIGYIKDA